jgi:hypothetical protein
LDTAVVLGLIAGSMHVVAFGIYNKQLFKGESVPNPATWLLWAIGTVLNLLTYFHMTRDWVKSLLPTMSSVACLATFVVALAKGKLSKPSAGDWSFFGFGLVALIIWKALGSAAYANLWLQLSVAVSFVPTFHGVWREPRKERCLPWFIWSVAYVFLFATVVMRWQGGWITVVYPVNGFVMHLIVGVLALRRVRQAR